MAMVLRYAAIVGINILVLVAMLAAVEGFYRYREERQPAEGPKNVLWQEFRPYTMFATTTGPFTVWHNLLTGDTIKTDLTNNNLGFRDDRTFTPTSVYRKQADEKVVILTGGSVAWGVGASTNANTIAGRMEHYLNEGSGGKTRYTVVNLAMGSFIAYQQFVALSLYGGGFDPDWVVVMDGFNDASVGCGQSQGSFNPMFFSMMKLYLDGYLLSSLDPVLYRGRLENLLLKHSAAARGITGQRPISLEPAIDPDGENRVRRVITKTYITEARDQLAFYLRAQELTFRLFGKAKFIFSTQPVVNDFRGDFVNAYDFPTGSPERDKAVAAREADLEQYLDSFKDKLCSVKTNQPAYTYVLVKGAFGLEDLASRLQQESGRFVDYVNTGTLLPNDKEKRISYFVDTAHLTDKGMDLLGKEFAARILRAEESGDQDVRAKNQDVRAIGIKIISATYGGNCGASPGNASKFMRTACNGRDKCDYVVSVDNLGDPASGCAKSFVAEYTCAPATTPVRREIPPEAGLGSKLSLRCTQEPPRIAKSELAGTGIRVISATYGENCNAPAGNVSKFVKTACNGRDECDYVVNVENLGDPASGCAKSFVAEYICAPAATLLRREIAPEAGLGSMLSLRCAKESRAAK